MTPALTPPGLPGAGTELRLADATTFRVGGPAARYVAADSEAELIDTVRAADAAGEAVLVLGGGSNLLVADAGFPGVVVRDTRTRLTVPDESACAGATVTAPAGAPWESVVDLAVTQGWVGVEALTGIPGSVGAAPVQNIGAYGQEVGQTISSVRVWDRDQSRTRTLAAVDLQLGYRTSLLKRSLRSPDGAGSRWAPTPRYVVLDVTVQLRLGDLSAPVGYGELARMLGIDVGSRAPLVRVRDAVRGLRTRKAMVLGAGDHDTWSAGSFFTNPVLPDNVVATLPADAPRYPAGDGLTKTSAAWLIEQAGFGRGFGLPGPAALSSKHTLALTNRGGATATDLLAVARTVRDGVLRRFAIELVPEPVLVGCRL